MRRSPVRKWAGIATWVVIGWLAGGGSSQVKAAPPNLVFIISDDQAYRDFGFMGNERVHTPNLDSLAARSARFVNGCVPTSVCRPSLVTLLTGLYPHQHGVWFNHGPPGNAGFNAMASAGEYLRVRSREFEAIRRHPTLPGILSRDLGYRCLQTGKFWEGHWRNGGFTEGMTVFESPPHSQAYGGGRTLANGDRVAHGNGDLGLAIGRETMGPITEFIDDCVSKRSPWMVWYAPYLPHQPHDSPEKFYALARSRPGVAEHELPYFASIAQFDDTVGQLVRQVEGSGAAANTIFVLVIDNGWAPSRRREKSRPEEFAHTDESKRSPFEDGLRTPILIRWDGVVTPATIPEPVSSIDLVPTLLRAAGAPEPAETLPGIDLMPAAKGEAGLDPGRAVFGEIYPGDATTLDDPAADIAYRWVRRGDHKLIVPHLHGEAKQPWGGFLKDGKPTLFDLRSDPVESRNVIAQHPDVAADLKARLEAWWPATEE